MACPTTEAHRRSQIDFHVVLLVIAWPIDLFLNFRRQSFGVDNRFVTNLAVVLKKLWQTVNMNFAQSLFVVESLIEIDPNQLSRSGEGMIVERKRFSAYHDLPDNSFQFISCKAFFRLSNSV